MSVPRPTPITAAARFLIVSASAPVISLPLQVSLALKDGQWLELRAHLWRQAAQRQFHAGVQRLLTVVGIPVMQRRHEFAHGGRGGTHASAGDLARQQHQGTGMPAHRLDQIGDVLRCAGSLGWGVTPSCAMT